MDNFLRFYTFVRNTEGLFWILDRNMGSGIWDLDLIISSDSDPRFWSRILILFLPLSFCTCTTLHSRNIDRFEWKSNRSVHRESYQYFLPRVVALFFYLIKSRFYVTNGMMFKKSWKYIKNMCYFWSFVVWWIQSHLS